MIRSLIRLPFGRRFSVGRQIGVPAVLALALAMTARSAGAEDPHWDYHSNGGPAAWGELTLEGSNTPAFPDCSLTAQSPVDIPAGAPVQDGIALSYEPTPLRVVNNGHTVQVPYRPGSTLTADGETYELVQLHFHAPSEHRIGGKAAALEAHFVHAASDGTGAVVGVLIEAGNPNPALQSVLDAMPREIGEATAPGDFDGAGLLPDELRHRAYDGSFTTPPCSEGVKWYVLAEPVEASLMQIADFRSLAFLRHEGEFIGNARPVQALNGRIGEAEGPVVVPPSTGSAGLR